MLDVLGLSHEISETYNDPFVAFDGVHNVTPWWLSPNGNCADILEVGDVIEGLPRQAFPMTMPNGFTYHPQNEALLQWFQFQSPSTARHRTFKNEKRRAPIREPAPFFVSCKRLAVSPFLAFG